eukprot:12794160-Ditylum_brightwellii.AAC.1
MLQTTYNMLSLKQAVNNSENIKCKDKIKSIFIEGLGQEFEKILDCHLTNTLPPEWNTTSIPALATATKNFKANKIPKKKLYNT